MTRPPQPRTDRLTPERMFVTVLETGSFAAAAARMGTSPGQASKLVSRLEADLGVQLIKRTTRALAPTEAGHAYHTRLRAIIEDLDTLDAEIRNTTGLPAGRLRLTAPMSFGLLRLTPVLLDFARAYPDIALDVDFSDRTVNLVDEGYDLAVRIGRPMDSGLIARKLCDARVVTIASPGYLEAHGTPAIPSDLGAHTCIIDTNFRDPGHWHFAIPAGGTTVIRLPSRLRFSNGDACLQAAVNGLGIARVPSFIAGEHLRDGRVRLLLPEAEGGPLAIHALYPAARHLALKVRTLVDFLAVRFRGKPDWDEGW